MPSSPFRSGPLHHGYKPIRRFDPYAIVLDSGQELGRDTHGLTAFGFEVEVIGDLDEAGKWLEIQGDRPGVGILPANLDEETIAEVISKVAARIPGGSGAMLLVGAFAGRAEARHLSDLGFQWLVRSPFTSQELHLGASAALGSGTWSDDRKDPRVPFDLKVDVARPGSIDTARVCDLSAGGMFLAMADPPEVGASLIIEVPLGARAMLLRGVAAHCSRRAIAGNELGVGVRFENLEECDARTVADYVEARLGSVRL